MWLALPGLLFLVVMAQPNLALGLMPWYREHWGLDPFLITLLFAGYLFALVATMATVGRPTGRTGWWWRIAAGSAGGVVADLIMAGSRSAVVACVARIVAGVSVGLVSGSLSGVILARAGERGRTAMAAFSVLGSGLGVMAAATFATYLPKPQTLVYLVHAVVLAALAGLVCASRNVQMPVGVAPGRAIPRRVGEPSQAANMSAEVGYLSGCGAWISAGLVAALLPTYGAQLLKTDNLALLALPVFVYLGAAWLIQRVVLPGALPAEPLIGQLLMVVGIAGMALVPEVRSLAMLITGGLVAGFGQGIAYRAGLYVVSAGREPAMHARVAARYGAVTYLSSAVSTVGLGAIAAESSLATAVVFGAIVLTCIAFLIGHRLLRPAHITTRFRTKRADGVKVSREPDPKECDSSMTGSR